MYIVIIFFVLICDIGGNGGFFFASCMTVLVFFCFVFLEDEREHTDNELILEMFLLNKVVDLERNVEAELGVDVAVEVLFGEVDTFAGLRLEGGV